MHLLLTQIDLKINQNSFLKKFKQETTIMFNQRRM